jgi:tRNA(Ile)-lysidine synthase
MAPLGPFEPAPRLAVAVSGGPDSMALALLAQRWTRARGGELIALHVDHGLRAESAGEARRVRGWLRRREVPSALLRWRGEKPSGNLQAAARSARYALLENWCRRSGILHLLVAHHRDDQAETMLMRLARGSLSFGLAGMPAISEREHVRLLRPLLAIGKSRLLATLEAIGQDWIEDPSNREPRFARTGVRRALAENPAGAAALAARALELGRERIAEGKRVAECLVRAVTLLPHGGALLDRRALLRCGTPVARRALADLLATVAGREHPARSERVAALHAALMAAEFRGRTLGGCIVAPTPDPDIQRVEPETRRRPNGQRDRQNRPLAGAVFVPAEPLPARQ